jgi:hypothetical protein
MIITPQVFDAAARQRSGRLAYDRGIRRKKVNVDVQTMLDESLLDELEKRFSSLSNGKFWVFWV